MREVTKDNVKNGGWVLDLRNFLEYKIVTEVIKRDHVSVVVSELFKNRFGENGRKHRRE